MGSLKSQLCICLNENTAQKVFFLFLSKVIEQKQITSWVLLLFVQNSLKIIK